MTKNFIGIIIFLLSLLLVNIGVAKEYYYNQKGEKNYIKEDYSSAEKDFLISNNEYSKYNIGNVSYRKKEYLKAIDEYNSIILGSKKDFLTFNASHNIGNCFYRLGKLDEEKKLEFFLNSVEYYDKALTIKYDEETKKNRDFVLNKIKELKENQNEEQEENSSNEENSNSSENKDNKSDDSNNKNNNGDNLNKDEKKGNDENTDNKENGEDNEDISNDESNNSNISNNNILNSEDKKALEEYSEMLKELQNNYSDGFNKNSEEKNIWDDFFFFPKFDNSIFEKDSNKKDW